MLNEQALQMLPERIIQNLAAVNTQYLKVIGEKIKEIGELRPTDVHRLQMMYEAGADFNAVKNQLASVSGKSLRDIEDMFHIVAKDNYDFAKPFYEARGIEFIPYSDNVELQRYVKSVAKLTQDTFLNITNTTAVTPNYIEVLDSAITSAQLGVTDYYSTIRPVVRTFVSQGLSKIEFESGWHRRIDTSVRQNVLWGIKQCNQNVADLVGEAFSADGYEISFHSHPRPSHAKMGGRQYAIGKARKVHGIYYPSFDDVDELLQDYGCLHFKFPIILGVSEPAYSDKQLKALKEADEKKFIFEGKEYTPYEATQVQRRLETKIRKEKDKAIFAKSAGDDELRREAQERINLLTHKYKQFSDASGLPTKMERASVSGFRKVKTKSELTNYTPGDTITIGRSLGAKAKNYQVKLPNGEYTKLTDGSRITNIVTIAGKGRTRQIDEIDTLLYKYPDSDRFEWMKKKGVGYVDYSGKSYKTELHWYEEPSVGKVKWKIKPQYNGEWFIDED